MYINLQCYICILYLNINIILSIDFLNKYSSIDIYCNSYALLSFDTSDFKIPSTFYFKVSTNSSLNQAINFEFKDSIDLDNNYNNLQYMYLPSKELYENNINENITIKYYNIEKNKNHVSNENCKYLIIKFECNDCNSTLKIENIKTDITSKKISTGQIIGIIGGCLGAIGLVITIICCYLKHQVKKNKKKQNQKKSNKNKIRKSVSIKRKKTNNEIHRRKSMMNPIIHNNFRKKKTMIPESSDSALPIKERKRSTINIEQF